MRNLGQLWVVSLFGISLFLSLRNMECLALASEAFVENMARHCAFFSQSSLMSMLLLLMLMSWIMPFVTSCKWEWSRDG